MPRPYEVEIEKNAKTDRRARTTMEPQKQSEREKQEPAPSPNKKAVQPPQAETEREGKLRCATRGHCLYIAIGICFAFPYNIFLFALCAFI